MHNPGTVGGTGRILTWGRKCEERNPNPVIGARAGDRLNMMVAVASSPSTNVEGERDVTPASRDTSS